ncbi:MAG: RNA polymerase sigma factor [Acidobacteriota bacterium]
MSTILEDPGVTAHLRALVARVAAGDRGAESLLVEHFVPRIKAMAVARTRNRELARDLTQETLIAVLKAARNGQVKDPNRIAAFVHGVARNIINNHLRRERDHPEAQFDEDAHGEVAAAVVAADDHAEQERTRILGRALAVLSTADRQVLLLTLVDGLKPGEIATRTGVSSEVIRTRKSRALKRVLGEISLLSRNPAKYHSTND